MAIGSVTALIFHIGTKEESQESLLPNEELSSQSRETVASSSPLGLFTQLRVYQVHFTVTASSYIGLLVDDLTRAIESLFSDVENV